MNIKTLYDIEETVFYIQNSFSFLKGNSSNEIIIKEDKIKSIEVHLSTVKQVIYHLTSENVLPEDKLFKSKEDIKNFLLEIIGNI